METTVESGVKLIKAEPVSEQNGPLIYMKKRSKGVKKGQL